jgi:hypothetical protein
MQRYVKKKQAKKQGFKIKFSLACFFLTYRCMVQRHFTAPHSAVGHFAAAHFLPGHFSVALGHLDI